MPKQVPLVEVNSSVFLVSSPYNDPQLLEQNLFKFHGQGPQLTYPAMQSTNL